MNQILFHLQQLYDQIPGWVITGMASAFTAIAGLAAKFSWDWVMEKRDQKHRRIAKLEKLSAMLIESKQLSNMQYKLADGLSRSIQERLKLDSFTGGYDSFFSNHFSTFTESELDTHAMIRSISINSLKRVNKEMLEWITENSEFKNNSVFSLRKKFGAEFSKKLTDLELHLNLWDDKFNVWIPHSEKHALITIGDEDSNGIPISEDMEGIILNVSETISHLNILSITNSPF